jgi:hypothetical protein
MSDITLRDHCFPCEHDQAFMSGDKEWEEEWWDCRICPGGRERTFRLITHWDTQDMLEIEWQPGFNGSRLFVEVTEPVSEPKRNVGPPAWEVYGG